MSFEFVNDVWHPFLRAFRSWIKPEKEAFIAAGSLVISEVQRIGPEIIEQVALAAAQRFLAGGGLTGAIISAAAEDAIETLKTKGKEGITATVYAAVSAFVLQLQAEGQAQTFPGQPASPLKG